MLDRSYRLPLIPLKVINSLRSNSMTFLTFHFAGRYGSLCRRAQSFRLCKILGLIRKIISLCPAFGGAKGRNSPLPREGSGVGRPRKELSKRVLKKI